jgi:5'-deoxynucleotidase YfbR-like HD superfamily hydrolase
MDRRGAWIQTHKGVIFYPFDPLIEEILLEDIAHVLSMACRFGGHLREFESIAQHSVQVAEHCQPKYKLMGLLHDASEVYLYDVAGPLKQSPAFSDYRKTEKKLMRVIYERFGVEWSDEGWADVYKQDKRSLMTEVRDLLGPQTIPWECKEEPYPEKIVPLQPKDAEKLFLDTFAALTKKH